MTMYDDLAKKIAKEKIEKDMAPYLGALCNSEEAIENLDNYGFSEEEIEYLRKNAKVKSNSIDSYTWGLDCIDSVIATPKKGVLTILVADENQGKSTFCYFMARKNYQKFNHKVIYYNLEQPKEEMISSMAMQYAGTSKLEHRDNQHLFDSKYLSRKKQLEEQEDIEFIGRKVDSITTLESIKEDVFAMGMDMLILDNLTCISTEARDRNEEMKKITIELTSMAQDLQIPIILVHHYRKRSGQMSTIFRDVHEMEGSGALKNLSSKIIQLARDPVIEGDEPNRDLHIREGKLRGPWNKQQITIVYDKGDFVGNSQPGF